MLTLMDYRVPPKRAVDDCSELSASNTRQALPLDERFSGTCASQAEDTDIEMGDTALSHQEQRSTGTNSTLPNGQKRIRTYNERKNEIEQLQTEIQQLRRYAEYLKQQAADTNDQSGSMEKKHLVNEYLREKVHQRLFLIARVQAKLSFYTLAQTKIVPFNSFVHLSKDQQKRIETLRDLKPRILNHIKRYMEERSRFADPSRPCTDYSKFVTRDGDYCASMFSVIPLRGITSVRRVFDAVNVCIANMANNTADEQGDFSSCVEDEVHDEGIIQKRLLRSLHIGVKVEFNQIVISDFSRQVNDGDIRETGLFAFVSVDKDDLYPYRPMDRLRQDITGAITVQTYKRKYWDEVTNAEEERNEVVLMRSVFLKVGRTKMDIPDSVLVATRDRLALTFTKLGEAVKEVLSRQ